MLVQPSRVRFCSLVDCIMVDAEGVELRSELELREADTGKYYPASASQRRMGFELQRSTGTEPVHSACSNLGPSADAGVFCACKDACRSACPCAAEGVGCWWEGWGCGCAGICTSNIPPHIFNERKVRNERKRKRGKARTR